MSGWFKVYNGMIDDPKIRLLSFEDRWHYVALLCCKADGIQDEVEGLWEQLLLIKLGLAEVEFESLKKRLLKVRLIDDDWNPTGWEKRQAAKDPRAAERQKKYRKKQAKRDVTRDVTHNVTATSQVEVRSKKKEEEKEKEKESGPPPARTKKIPPSVDEVNVYCKERKNGIDAQRFVDYYEARDWYSNKTKIKCWKSCVRTWEGRDSTGRKSSTHQVDYL